MLGLKKQMLEDIVMIDAIIHSLQMHQQDVMCADGNTLEREEELDAQVKFLKECGELITELNYV
jgi:hypothetical protein